MPVTEAAAYLLAVLPAIGYLHDHGLIYCDFKPDNVIHEGDAVKLIDLGGVRRWDDTDAAIFGTVGYQAPEVPKTGPTVASDLYTVGRALAVLILDWPGWTTTDVEQPARPGRARRAGRARLPVAVPRAGLRARPRRSGSATPTRWPTPCTACCARWRRRSTATRGPAPAPATARPVPGSTRSAGRRCPARCMPNHPRIANRVAGRRRGRPRGRGPHGAGRRGAELGRHRGRRPGPLRARRTSPQADSVVGQLDATSPEAGEFAAVHRQRPVLPPRRVGAGRGRRGPGGAVPRRRLRHRPRRGGVRPRAGRRPGRRRAIAPGSRRPPTCSSRWR